MCKFAFSSNMLSRKLVIHILAKSQNKCFFCFEEKVQVCIFVKYMQSGTLGIQILAHFHDGHSALTASPTERRQPTSHLETGRDIWIFQQIFENRIFEFCNRQDPASTMQKTGWTINSFFLVLSGLKKSFTLVVITRGQSTTIFLCIGPFSAWWRTNTRTTRWS